MKEQTFISAFEKEADDGTLYAIDFERWSYKKESTVIRKLTLLYSGEFGYGNFMMNKLIDMDADYMSIYKTNNGTDELTKRISICGLCKGSQGIYKNMKAN